MANIVPRFFKNTCKVKNFLFCDKLFIVFYFLFKVKPSDSDIGFYETTMQDTAGQSSMIFAKSLLGILS